MSLKSTPVNALLQMEQCGRLMQQADARWEELTRCIQADEERLAILQQHLENFHLVLALDGKLPPCPTTALATQIAALKQQIALLEERVAVERAQRAAVIRQFDRARLALVALRKRTLLQEQTHAAFVRQLLAVYVRRPLHRCWSALYRSGDADRFIPGFWLGY